MPHTTTKLKRTKSPTQTPENQSTTLDIPKPHSCQLAKRLTKPNISSEAGRTAPGQWRVGSKVRGCGDIFSGLSAISQMAKITKGQWRSGLFSVFSSAWG